MEACFSVGIEPDASPGSNEAAIAERLRHAAAWEEISTELLPEEVSDIFANVGRREYVSLMTFHRNPYCWHELMNYLQVDPLARGYLYGLANINAVGWQEATLVLLKLIDEKTIVEAGQQENKEYYDRQTDK